ncbi:hypothetical protein HZA55_09255 [Candidatus Poribacteria bacterium]|nr:hypothetical protein [Candidatus Poribacteria bacterium]
MNLHINEEFLKKFLSPPVIEDEYYETDKTIGISAYVIVVSIFTMLFYIPSISKLCRWLGRNRGIWKNKKRLVH